MDVKLYFLNQYQFIQYIYLMFNQINYLNIISIQIY